MCRFLSHLKHEQECFIRYKTLELRSRILYVTKSTTARVSNSTAKKALSTVRVATITCRTSTFQAFGLLTFRRGPSLETSKFCRKSIFCFWDPKFRGQSFLSSSLIFFLNNFLCLLALAMSENFLGSYS